MTKSVPHGRKPKNRAYTMSSKKIGTEPDGCLVWSSAAPAMMVDVASVTISG